MIKTAAYILTFICGIYSSLDEAESLEADWPQIQNRMVMYTVINENDTTTGSGYLLNRSTILTCAHVLGKFDRIDTVVYIDENKISSYVEKYVKPVRINQVHAESEGYGELTIEKILVHPGYGRFYDLALMKISPINDFQFETENIYDCSKDDTVISFGYGIGLTAESLNQKLPLGTLRHGFNLVDSIKPFESDFHLYTSLTPVAESNHIIGEHVPYAGDSGGPVFVLKNKKPMLVGVMIRVLVDYEANSFLSKNYSNSIGVTTAIGDSMRTWISTNLN